jgi:molecular chaperone DnaK
MSENKVFGIDLGTTFSVIAHIDSTGGVETIPNVEGSRITPSVIWFDGDNRIVGEEAKSNAVLFEDQVVVDVKREMGQEGWVFFYNGEEYKPEEISSYILRKLVNDAENYVGHEIKDVVITCPAYFGINEREATAKAGEIAGLNVRSIINEPTAAAIAYGVHESEDQVVLVYDLGGGTFDITMIEIKTGEINVIATGGDHNLGGKNWDGQVVNYLAEQWQEAAGSDEDPMDDMETLQDLFLNAEKAKISLTARETTEVAVVHAGSRERVTLTREKFDELTGNLLERTIQYTHDMLTEAKKKGYTQFDQILLVGGSSRMPQISARVQQEFDLEPKLFDPDEAVAKGAAIFAQKLAIGDMIKYKIEGWGLDTENVDDEKLEEAMQEVAVELGLPSTTVEQMQEMEITNITSVSFGVIVIDRASNKEVVSNLIKINDNVPVNTAQQFGTVESDQQNAEIRVVQNRISEDTVEVDDCEDLGNALLPLPAGLPAGAPVEITFNLNEQGRLHVRARELTGNKDIEAEFETTGVISGEEFEVAKSRAKGLVVS